MISKNSADFVNNMFETELWKQVSIDCAVCRTAFQYEPYIYTYPDGLQSICCSKECHAWLKREMKAKAILEAKQLEP